MANKINLFGWMIVFLFSITGIFGYGIIKNDKLAQQEKIKHYEREVISNEKTNETYFGYIHFPKHQVNRLIEYGNPSEIVDKYNIGIFGPVPTSLKNENLILVGHNRPNQFSVVLKLKAGDMVMIVHEKQKYQYQVMERKVIDSDDLNFLKSLNTRTLVLITCLDDASKRIVIFCKLQQM